MLQGSLECLPTSIRPTLSSNLHHPLLFFEYQAHHVNPKAAKRKVKNRPKKSRASDRMRKAPEYNTEPQYFEGAPAAWTVASNN